MSPKNVVVFVHGMTRDKKPSDPTAEFSDFWDALRDRGLDSFERSDAVFAGWGHEPEQVHVSLRPDQRICRAQAHISRLINRAHVKRCAGPNNIVRRWPWNLDVVLGWTIGLREHTIQHGLTDVIYYCSAEGERAVRRTVYSQVLKHLDEFADAGEVRLHLIAHSLGVTVAHDFLFGLFGQYDEGYGPGFLREEQGDEHERARFEQWRERARNGTLTVGSITSMASQLPLMIMRKQALVDRFFHDERLDPLSIGLRSDDKEGPCVKWNVIYDLDDVLGFASRDIYHDPHGLIRQIQVKCGGVVRAHTGYLKNREVRRRTVELINANMS
ncbi:MAG: hypothetical protein GF331_20985 [Chitinivibrionales bacterium]|nr:hypothetical protein [Chitinivibrionales bacterium]